MTSRKSSIQVRNENVQHKKLNWLGFFLFGLINNFVYVIFLSAAEDIIKNSSGLVLFCDIVPAFIIKLTLPQYQHLISYKIRIVVIVLFSVASLLMVALTTSVTAQLAGIVFGAISSGMGEVTYLAMSTFYKTDVLSGWSCGTGGAGIFGSAFYLIFTSLLGISTKNTLLSCIAFSGITVITFLFVISHPYLEIESQRLNSNDNSDEDSFIELEQMRQAINQRPEHMTWRQKSVLIKSLFLKFMIPLFFVYWAEYTINQGISPNILYPLNETPFRKLRDHYVYYQFLYQIGVFLSRSSVMFVHINKFWITSCLQVVILVIFLLKALLVFAMPVYLVFVIIFIEGLLGGACYANAFRVLNTDLPANIREYSISVTTLADSLGITLASVTALLLQPAICSFQVSKGVNLCKI